VFQLHCRNAIPWQNCKVIPRLAPAGFESAWGRHDNVLLSDSSATAALARERVTPSWSIWLVEMPEGPALFWQTDQNAQL
jgi:hypothetical protein